ncbi:187-kDa microtubule-associated protein AIR9, partial [Phalaenopsis equestris]|uniref:187-kDa microtubule-associated protein AIR9 n=1 Tax=Phalaenopsis equestris TaxID=78828 RepID=UPI0009E5A43D
AGKKVLGNGTPGSSRIKSSLMKPTLSSSAASLPRRNSTGGISEKQAVTGSKLSSKNGKNESPSMLNSTKKSSAESRRSSLPPVSSKVSTPEATLNGKKASLSSRLPSKFNNGAAYSMQRSSVKALEPLSSLRSVSSPSLESSNGHSKSRKTTLVVSSPSARSPPVTSSLKLGSLSASVDRNSSLPGKKKTQTVESGDSRFMMLPQVDAKAKDDLRLDLRGHGIRSLDAAGLNLSPTLEFVYLRDNLLSSVKGIEILKRVKVLDLSFNDFKGPDFEPLGNCKSLQQLYLAGNQITSLAGLPELPSLEFLSVAQNKLKSLCMATQPRLQVLAASKNKISSFKGFPLFPVLENLRLEENPILQLRHVEAASILLVGPTLKKFNDRDLSPKELEVAKSYPPHASICIRDGWQFDRPDLAADSTFSFLLEKWKEHLPPGFMLEETSVDQPFEEDICHCHFRFINLSSDSELVLKYQWFVGERTPSKFEAIADAIEETYWPKHEDIGKFLKVECTPILKEAVFPPIFAISAPVSPGTGYPKVLNLNVQGELIEGNVVRGSAEIAWCGGTPGKCVASWLRRRWNSSPVVIAGAENEDYLLTVADIDSSLVFMYTPVTEEGTKGEPQYAITDFVKAASPSVSNVRILGDAVEGITIEGTGEYFGGIEGPSKFQWLREDEETGDLVVVSAGSSDYTLTKQDVGRHLVFVYIPANFEGQEGESVSIASQIVRKAPPKVTNLKIVGDLREGSKLTVTATVIGGNEGSSRVQWFKTLSSEFADENSLEAISSSKIAKTVRVPLGAVGYYIVSKFSPVAADGETGESAFVISEKVIETLPPSLNFLSITGNYCEGEVLTASYGYFGGHEGRSLFNWYLHDAEGTAGLLITEASGSLQYRITRDAISKFISFKCTPVRDDGIIGEPRTFWAPEPVLPGNPRLLSLEIVGEGVEGTTLYAEKKYWGGEEGNSVYHWFLTAPDGAVTEVEGSNSASYKVSCSDIGFLISVSCEPIRSDWAHGPTVTSEHIGPIVPGPPCCHSLEFVGSLVEGNCVSFVASYSGGVKGNCIHEWFRLKENGVKEMLTDDEFLYLTFEDVGRSVELVYTPVREDGLRGPKKCLMSATISPADPKGIELVIPDCLEDEEIIPLKSYYGGKEGNAEYVWYRTRCKPDELNMLNVTGATGDFVVVGTNMTYTPTLEDVGSYLMLNWVPTRDDGKRGSPVISVGSNPVMAALPVVSNVCMKYLGSEMYQGEGQYYGGIEGSSIYTWYRQTSDGTIILIPGATSINYKAEDPDYNCRLLFGYTPVRSDSAIGELVLSEASNIVLPELPKIELLSFNGKELEGEILTAVEIIPKTENQKYVWTKYKKDVKYQWFYSVSMGEHQSFELFPTQQSSSYRVRFEDIGRCLKCECTVNDVFGRSSETVSAVTSPILPGMPKISKLEIEGRGFHTNLYAVRGVYSGGKEGKSKIQWLRSMVGSPDLISIPGESGRMYEANVDDVGYRLVALYTPIREDGVEGESVSISTEPIAVEPDVSREVKQKLDMGSVKFEALIDKEKKVPGAGNLEKRILEVNRKRIKVVKPGSKTSFPVTEIRGTYAPPFHVELYRNDQHRFKIVVDSENEVDLMVQTRHTRDIIVLVIRGLAQRFNSTSLNSLLKIDN